MELVRSVEVIRMRSVPNLHKGQMNMSYWGAKLNIDGCLGSGLTVESTCPYIILEPVASKILYNVSLFSVVIYLTAVFRKPY